MNDYLPNTTSDHINCSCYCCFHLLAATGTCIIVGFKFFTKYMLYKKMGCNNAVLEIKCRRLRWLGHNLRMPGDSIPKVALRWTPPGKRKRGRPKMTWRQTVMAELREMGLSRMRFRPQPRTGPCGETLLWPCVPEGTKRISKKLNTCIVSLSHWSIYLIGISKCARMRKTRRRCHYRRPRCRSHVSRQLNIYGHCATLACSQISPRSLLQFARQRNCLKLNNAGKRTAF